MLDERRVWCVSGGEGEGEGERQWHGDGWSIVWKVICKEVKQSIVVFVAMLVGKYTRKCVEWSG